MEGIGLLIGIGGFLLVIILIGCGAEIIDKRGKYRAKYNALHAKWEGEGSTARHENTVRHLSEENQRLAAHVKRMGEIGEPDEQDEPKQPPIIVVVKQGKNGPPPLPRQIPYRQ